MVVGTYRTCRFELFLSLRYWAMLFVACFVWGCSTPAVVAPVGEGFHVIRAGCTNCQLAKREIMNAKRYCADRGKHYWSVTQLDGLDLSEMPVLVFYCDDQFLDVEPLYHCNRISHDMVRANFANEEVVEVSRKIFPASGATSVDLLRHKEIADNQTRKVVALLTPVYEKCVVSRSALVISDEPDNRQVHLSARLDLLKQLHQGQITLSAYAKALSILNGQFQAGVFYQ